jgi:hypothetical protein
MHNQDVVIKQKIFEFQTERLRFVQFFYCGVYQLTLQYDVLRCCTLRNHGYTLLEITYSI